MMLITIQKERIKKHNSLTVLAALFYILLPMPFLRMTGSVPMAAIIGIIICILNILKRKRVSDYYILIVSFTFIFGELLALTECSDISKTITFTFQKFIVVLIIYPTMIYTLKKKNQLQSGISYYKYGCLFVALLSLVAYILNVNMPFVGTKFATSRLIIAGIGPNVIARMFCIGALIALYQAQIAPKREKAFCYIEYIIFVLAILATISTAGLMMLVFGSVFVCYNYNEGIHRFGIIKVFGIMMLTAVLLVVLYQFVPFVRTQIERLIVREAANRMLDVEGEGFSLHGRVEGLENYGRNALQHAVVGVGYGNSSVLNGRTIHFPILAALVETGILGLISCVYMYGFAFFAGVKLLKNKAFAFYGILSITIILGDMVQPNPNYIFTWFAIFLSICAYKIMNDKRLNKKGLL